MVKLELRAPLAHSTCSPLVCLSDPFPSRDIWMLSWLPGSLPVMGAPGLVTAAAGTPGVQPAVVGWPAKPPTALQPVPAEFQWNCAAAELEVLSISPLSSCFRGQSEEIPLLVPSCDWREDTHLLGAS